MKHALLPFPIPNTQGWREMKRMDEGMGLRKPSPEYGQQQSNIAAVEPHF